MGKENGQEKLPLNKLRIAIIDDNQSKVRKIHELLQEKLGINITINFPDYDPLQKCLERNPEFDFDYYLMDYCFGPDEMPLGGIYTEKLRSLRPGAKVIGVSANGYSKRFFIDAGAIGFTENLVDIPNLITNYETRTNKA
jgi:hypothetical protein